MVVDTGGPVLPIQKGDKITLLGPADDGTRPDLEWSIDQNGVLTIGVPPSLTDQVEFAWAFEVSYAI